jgi:hypothetical protein
MIEGFQLLLGHEGDTEVGPPALQRTGNVRINVTQNDYAGISNVTEMQLMVHGVEQGNANGGRSDNVRLLRPFVGLADKFRRSDHAAAVALASHGTAFPRGLRQYILAFGHEFVRKIARVDIVLPPATHTVGDAHVQQLLHFDAGFAE